MNQLKTLFEQSGMSVKDFAYAIGESNKRVVSWLRGEWEAPQDVIGKAHQLLSDLVFWDAYFKANPYQQCSYKIFKYVLDTPAAVR
jgi:transcriptional regulator with XRE-family HTH domain